MQSRRDGNFSHVAIYLLFLGQIYQFYITSISGNSLCPQESSLQERNILVCLMLMVRSATRGNAVYQILKLTFSIGNDFICQDMSGLDRKWRAFDHDNASVSWKN